jgi:hypothetical protein
VKNYLYKIQESENGLDCYINYSGPPRRSIVIKSVHENVVRCAIGEDTLSYLLHHSQDGYCQLSEAEILDFKKHRVMR